MKRMWIVGIVLVLLCSSFSLGFYAQTNCPKDIEEVLDLPGMLEIVDVGTNSKAVKKIHKSYDKFVGKSLTNNLERANAGAPLNQGKIWIPQEACGQSVDLIIALHGHRPLQNPTKNTYLDFKDFDGIVRDHFEGGKIRPIIIAAPMHDRGPNLQVFDPTQFNMISYMFRIEQLLQQKKTDITIKSVSFIGHSNALCSKGMEKAAQSIIDNFPGKYPLYFIGAADGTCDPRTGAAGTTSEYVSGLLDIAKKSNAILFHMHQGKHKTDRNSADVIKGLGGGSDMGNAVNAGEYDDAWKTGDEVYTYQVKRAGHSHKTIPGALFKEALIRFFPRQGATAIQSIPLFGIGGNQAAQRGVLKPQTRTITRNVPGCSRCKGIDIAWLQVARVIGSDKVGIWNTLAGTWTPFNAAYGQTTEVIAGARVPSRSPTSPYTGGLSLPKGKGKCLEHAYSATEQQAVTKLVPMTFRGQPAQVHLFVKPLLERIDQQITQSGIQWSPRVGANRWRCVSSPDVKILDQNTCENSQGGISISKHSYGIALDFDASANPFCKSVGGKLKLCDKNGNNCKPCPVHSYNGKHYTIPEGVISIFKANDFNWGGDWTGSKDFMHFVWNGNAGDFNGDGTLEQCAIV